MQTYLIEHAGIVTVNSSREIIDFGYVRIQGDQITEVGKGNCSDPGDCIRIDASGKIVFPGLINTHNHLFQTLLKGLGDDKNLADWLSTMTFPGASHITREDVKSAALHGCIEGVRSGTTTMVDYMYPHPREGLSDGVIDAFTQIGMRGILARGMMNTGEQFGTPRAIMQDIDTISKDLVRLFDTYHGSQNGRIGIWAAPAAIWSNSRELLSTVWEITRSYGSFLTVHISETPFDREAAKSLHGMYDAEVLQELGILGPQVLMVHCVYLTDRDIRMAVCHDMKVSHNPVSNMYLSSGVAPIPDMVEKGLTVGLGTDGSASNNSQDMIELLKFTALLQKVHTKDPTVITAERVLEMATIDGARAVGLEKSIGSIEKGKKADLFIYNPLGSPKSIPMHHPVSALVYSGSDRCVETVFIDGRPVMLDGQFTEVNELQAAQECSLRAQELAVRSGMSSSRPWKSTAF